MKREISHEEVLAIEAFCIKHYVKYYDVRQELVDHLASFKKAKAVYPLAFK